MTLLPALSDSAFGNFGLQDFPPHEPESDEAEIEGLMRGFVLNSAIDWKKYLERFACVVQKTMENFCPERLTKAAHSKFSQSLVDHSFIHSIENTKTDSRAGRHKLQETITAMFGPWQGHFRYAAAKLDHYSLYSSSAQSRDEMKWAVWTIVELLWDCNKDYHTCGTRPQINIETNEFGVIVS